MKRPAVKYWIVVLCLLLPCPAAYASEVKEVVSKNGITAWLVEEHSLPIIAVKIAFRQSGVAYDPPGKEGRANITAAMLMEGAGDLGSNAFNDALDNNAIELNFAIDEDLFRASLATISDKRDTAFSLLGLALTKPRFDADALERVRSQNFSMLQQQEKEPTYLLRRKWETTLFGTHPYANPSLGTRESTAAMKAADLQDFVRRYLTRENIVVAVTGDITPKELARQLDANFANLPAHYDPDVKVAEVTVPQQAQQVVVESAIPQTMVLFGTQGIKRDDKRYYAAYVMNYMLGGGNLNSRLIDEIREKRGLAYAVDSQTQPMDHGALWSGGFATRNEKVSEALAVLRDTLKDFVQKGPSAEDLADAKRFITGSFVLGLDSNGEIAGYLLSMQLNHLGRDYLDRRNAIFNAVTLDDVRAVARQLADPKGLQVVMVGKPVLDSK